MQQPLTEVNGIGPEKAALLASELKLFTIGDLLEYFPFRYNDRSRFYTVQEALEADIAVQIKGKLRNIREVKAKKMRLEAEFFDETGSIDLVWFAGLKWIKSGLKTDTEMVLYGKPSVFNRKVQISHPELNTLESFRQQTVSALQPVYNTTDKMKAKYLDSKGLERIIKPLLLNYYRSIPENLPDFLLHQLKMPSKSEAMLNVHLPQQAEMLRIARHRLAFEEFFYHQLQLGIQNKLHKMTYRGFVFERVGDYFMDFYTHYLPFKLTVAQQRVVREIRNDVGSGRHMNRLLQGDVGSGKTVVALMAMLLAIDNGFQCCLMAPTEILAAQHFQTLRELLGDMPVHIELLTGSVKKSERTAIHSHLKDGQLHILVGTHAVLEPDVIFKNLGFVVIDEQHRFGVQQRAILWKKNTSPPHVLIMSATPIPRTLAMTLYGDLDISIIDELPPGRKPVKTLHYFEEKRLRLFGFMKEQLRLGRQIYVVYPLIEESEKLDLANLEAGYFSLLNAFPRPEFQIGMVHGKQKPEEKNMAMELFKNGNTHILVSTTVIEVGVNVPNASVMVIENAERFGLSQLHQLRGRVGRGADQSYCILMTSFKLSQDARTRIKTMCETNDGFKIAEVDLNLRGPGELSGTRQSGVEDFKIADLVKDNHILLQARTIAQEVLEKDSELTQPQHQLIAAHLAELKRTRRNWGRIS